MLTHHEAKFVSPATRKNAQRNYPREKSDQVQSRDETMLTIEEIAKQANLDPDIVEFVLQSLVHRRLVKQSAEGYEITPKGEEALKLQALDKLLRLEDAKRMRRN